MDRARQWPADLPRLLRPTRRKWSGIAHSTTISRLRKRFAQGGSSEPPRDNRERMTQFMFETFNVSAMYEAAETVLFLCASGRTTDIAMDTGDGVSHTTVPIYEGCTLLHAILCLAGRDFAGYPMKNVTERECFFTAATERVFVRDVKEKLRYIGADYDTVLKSTAGTDQEKTYVFPDENIVTVVPNVSVSRKYCSSHTVPIYESHTLHHAILRWPGRDLTEYLMKHLTEQGHYLSAAAERKIARDVKDKPCYICLDFRHRAQNRPRKWTRRRPTSLHTKTSSPSAPNVDVARKCCSCQVSMVQEQRITQHFSPEQHEVRRFTSVKSCTPCRADKWHDHVQRDFREHDKGTDGVVSIHDEDKVFASPV